MGQTKWVSPKLTGFVSRAVPRYCVRCRFNEGLPAPSPQLRRLELARQGIILPVDVSFNAEVLMKRDLPHDGTQVYFIGKREGAYARFLREQYQCESRCRSNTYALTLVGADKAHVLHPVFMRDGGMAVEVELEEITRTDGKSHYKRGTAEALIVGYIRSMFGEIGYRPSA